VKEIAGIDHLSLRLRNIQSMVWKTRVDIDSRSRWARACCYIWSIHQASIYILPLMAMLVAPKIFLWVHPRKIQAILMFTRGD